MPDSMSIVIIVLFDNFGVLVSVKKSEHVVETKTWVVCCLPH